MCGRLIRQGRSEAEAGEKEAFYLHAGLRSVREGSTDGAGLEKCVGSYIFIVLLRPLTILVPLQVLKISISHSFRAIRFMWSSSSGFLLL